MLTFNELPLTPLTVCDPYVFYKGVELCVTTEEMRGLNPTRLNEMCEALSQHAVDTKLSVKFDWYYLSESPIILYLGKHADAVSICSSHCDLIETFLPITVGSQMAKTSQPLAFRPPNATQRMKDLMK